MSSYIITAVAGEDLSADDKLGLVVHFDAADEDKVKVQDTDTAVNNAGILCEGAADDGTVQIVSAGPALGRFGGVVQPGERVISNASGRLVTAEGTNSKAVLGQYFGNANTASGDLREVYVFPNKATLTPAA